MEFILPSGNSAHKMADTSTLDDLRDILLHPGDFKQTIETTYNLCISQTVSKNEIINIINETKGDVSQKSIALWVYNKMYPKEDKDQVENEDKENANPNVGTKNIHRLTVMNVMKKNKDMIDYWNSLISQFIDENLKEFRNLEIDPIKSVTPYAINGGRLRKIKKTKKKRLHKRKQSRNRKQSRKR